MLTVKQYLNEGTVICECTKSITFKMAYIYKSCQLIHDSKQFREKLTDQVNVDNVVLSPLFEEEKIAKYYNKQNNQNTNRRFCL